MVAIPGPSANCCVIAVPSIDDANRVARVIMKVARLAGGAPVAEPHVTLAYYYNVSEAQTPHLGAAVANLARQSPLLVLQACGLIRDPAYNRPTDPYALFFEVEKTPPIVVFYTWLRQVGIRQGVDVSPNDADAWLPHIKVIASPTPVADAALEEIEALVPQLHFTATHLVLTYRGTGDTWATLGAYPLTE